jgi:hypothetical protein
MDLSGLSQVQTGLSTVSGLIMVTPQNTIGYQPQNNPSYLVDTSAALPPALIFNYEGEQKVSLTADITDHYIEDNTAIQDQIAIKPTIITTHGFVGELNDIFPGFPQTLNQLQSKLVTISSYTPALSLTALIALATAQQAYQVVSQAAKAVVSGLASINGTGQQSVINGAGISNGNSSVVNQATQTQQQLYFTQFYSYFINQALFTVQTPWAVFQDMAIMSLTAIQDADTNVITDFEIQFKQIRYASSLVDTSNIIDPNDTDGQLSDQSAPVSNNGTSTLTTSPTAFPSDPSAVL